MKQPDTDAAGRPFSCLVVDDSLFARKNIEKIVSSIGGVVIGEAGNGAEAVEKYESLRPDLVLMDITMPELDGVDALRRIMQMDKDAKVIMVTSIGHKDMVIKALGLGARHFVNKPCNHAHTGMIIRSVIDEGNGGPQ